MSAYDPMRTCNHPPSALSRLASRERKIVSNSIRDAHTDDVMRCGAVAAFGAVNFRIQIYLAELPKIDNPRQL